MTKKKKNNIFNKIYNILGIEGLFFETGKYVALIVGASMIIERMVEFYINYNVPASGAFLFNLAYMFAIFSIPIALSVYFLKIMFGEQDD